MGKFLFKMSLKQLCELIVLTLLNKFDFFLVIEGNTGTGKSTLAVHIARGVRAEFKRLFSLKEDTVEYYYKKVIEKQHVTMEEFCEHLLELKKKKAYNYNPYHDLIYDQKTMLRGLTSWDRIIIPDELINITFNRDFHGDMQKKIIKAINMFRDHKNLIIASVPQFQTLDVQIKNLTKMRISIAKRGAGIIQTPNKIIYARDKWDSANNEKIEREWLLHGNKPKYKKLTTARGIIRFPQLTKKIEEEYQKIKNEKRSNIVEKDMGITITEEKKEPFDIIYEQLNEKKIRNIHQFDGMCLAYNLDPETIRAKASRKLIKDCKTGSLKEFFWDKKATRKDISEDADALTSLTH